MTDNDDSNFDFSTASDQLTDQPLFTEFSQEHTVQHKKIYQLFSAYAAAHPNAIALVHNEKSMTYGELNQQANQIAHYLIEQGVKPGDLVAICLMRSIELVMGILGILKAGATYVPLDFTMPKERLNYVLTCSQTPLLLSQSSFAEKFTDTSVKTICLDLMTKNIASCPTSDPVITTAEDDIAYIIFTSGSTGKPKGVMVYHKAVSNLLNCFCSQMHFTHKDTSILLATVSFDISVLEIFLTLTTGAKLIIADSEVAKDPDLIHAQLIKHHVTWMQATPTTWKSLALNQWPGLKSLTLLTGGEPLPSDLARYLLPRCKALWTAYGPTETTVYSSLFQVLKVGDELNVPIGFTIKDTDFYILDESLNQLPEGEPGELYIGGIGLAKGYINRQDLTEAKFISNPFAPNLKGHEIIYRSGDICRLRSDGNMDCLGRIDTQVKIRGFRIELGEIESVLKTHKAISEAVVKVIENALGDKVLAAYYLVKKGETEPLEETLFKLLKANLPEYMVPLSVQSIPSIPVNLNGKVDKTQLPDPITIKHSSLKATNNLEKQLLAIWQTELGTDEIGIQDDFFMLGGTSLSAVRVTNAIKRQLGMELCVKDLYQHKTIASLSQHLTDQGINQTGIHSNDKSQSNSQSKDLTEFLMAYSQIGIWLANIPLNALERYRCAGKLNADAIQYALEKVVAKHLLYAAKMSAKSPKFLILTAAERQTIKVEEIDIRAMNEEEMEKALGESLDQFNLINDWKKATGPLIKLRLFYLPNNRSELQVVMPHTISDEMSMYLFFEELSHFYLAFMQKLPEESVERDDSYLEFITNDRNYVKKYSQTVEKEWDAYLKDIDVFAFPSLPAGQKQIKHYQAFALKPEDLNRLNKACSQHKLAVFDVLMAAIAKVLFNYTQAKNTSSKNLLLAFTKSMRNSQEFDKTMGNFALIDYLKVSVNQQDDIETLAKQIGEKKMRVFEAYGPYLIQITALFKKFWPKKPIKTWLVKWFTHISDRLNRSEAKFDKYFLKALLMQAIMQKNPVTINQVYINVYNDFIKPTPLTSLFGYQPSTKDYYDPTRSRFPVDMEQYKNTLFIHFDRAENKAPYLIIGGSFPEAFREEIGHALLEQLKAFETKSS